MYKQIWLLYDCEMIRVGYIVTAAAANDDVPRKTTEQVAVVKALRRATSVVVRR